jgi:hypothetical protein
VGFTDVSRLSLLYTREEIADALRAGAETVQPATGTVRPAGFFVVRSPLLPYDDLAAWSAGLEAPDAVDDPDRLDDALQAVRDGLAREHRADQALLRQIGERFRAERAGIEPLLDGRYPEVGPLEIAATTLPRLAARLAPAMAALRQAADRDDLTLSLSDLAPSLLHMHANRMLCSEQRRQEMVLYDFLYRLNDARAARVRAQVGSR